MPSTLQHIDHVCATVRRQILAETPDLNLIFIVYKKGQFLKALNNHRQEFYKHPTTEHFFNQARQSYPASYNQTELAAIIHVEKKGILPFFKRVQNTAVCFVNHDHIQQLPSAHYSIYRLAWHALQTIAEISEQEQVGPSPNFTLEDNIYTIHLKDEQLAYNNLLGDAFAAILISLNENKDAILELGRRRAEMTLKTAPGYYPEAFPFPLIAESADLFFKELNKYNPPERKKINYAQHMAMDIGETFDLSTVAQWTAFARPAQDLAHLNVDKETNLSFALFTSEDPYARASAYALADLLNLEISIVDKPNIYNPYTSHENNRAQHERLCLQLYKATLSAYNRTGNPAEFHRAAIKNAHDYVHNHQIMSWCSASLISIYSYISQANSDLQSAETQNLEKIFLESLSDTPWREILSYKHRALQELHSGTIDLEEAYLLAIDPDSTHHSAFFQILKDLNAFKSTANPEENKKTAP